MGIGDEEDIRNEGNIKWKFVKRIFRTDLTDWARGLPIGYLFQLASAYFYRGMFIYTGRMRKKTALAFDSLPSC